jgi:tRNA A37 methylthiotransferase MiaB
MNVYDSDMFGRVLRPLGYVTVPEFADADLIIVNTCSVRPWIHRPGCPAAAACTAPSP